MRTGFGATALTEPREETPTEAEDVAAAAAGDVRAFERLYRRHVARVHSLARRMMGPEDADEATQDVFVRVWEKLDTFRGDAKFGTWLHRVAINLMLGKRKKRGRRRERFVEGEAILETFSSHPVRSETRIDFESAIECLPDGAREVLVLHDVEGYKHREIARQLGISPGTSKSQLHRARMMLREHLER